MYKDLNTAIEILESRKNMKLGVDGLINALNDLGNPQLNLKMIHIAGTNGKGSTTNFTRSILEEAGYKVGTFTSPHLIVHNDRIRINDINIPDDRFLEYINQTQAMWDKYFLSMFEIDMMISVLYFIEEKVDYVVYEVGLGGRLDATNVIKPLITAITNVDYDHMNILGNTLEEIAFEKAGIIKQGVPLLTTEIKPEVLKVFKNQTCARNAPYKVLDAPKITLGNKAFTLHYKEDINLENQGIYQRDNANLAINIIECLNIGISPHTIKLGIEKTHWAGRFEEVVSNVYVDGAHNNQGMTKLIESLEMLPKPWIVVFSALSDKTHHAMLERLQEKVDLLIVTEFDFYRAASAKELSEGLNVTVVEDYKEAIDKGISLKEKGTLLVTGSLYFISDARAYILDKYKK